MSDIRLWASENGSYFSSETNESGVTVFHIDQKCGDFEKHFTEMCEAIDEIIEEDKPALIIIKDAGLICSSKLKSHYSFANVTFNNETCAIDLT